MAVRGHQAMPVRQTAPVRTAPAFTATRARADREKDPGASADRKVFRMAGRTPDREWKALTTVVKKAV